MTDKHAVIEMIQQLPEDTTLDQILSEVRVLTAIRNGRADIAAGHTKSQQQVKELVSSWISARGKES